MAAFLRGFLLQVPFLCLVVDSAAAGPCRDRVDLNARARGAVFDELEFNQCISTEASRFMCVMLLRPRCDLADNPCGVSATRAVSLSVEPALKNVICPRRLSLLPSASAIRWREYRRGFCIYDRAPLRGPSAGPSRESIADIMQVSSKSQRPTTLPLIAEMTAAKRRAPPCPRRADWRQRPSLWNLALSAAGPAEPPPRRRATFVAPHKAIALPQPRPRRGKNRHNTK